jgi:hypothetical protein
VVGRRLPPVEQAGFCQSNAPVQADMISSAFSADCLIQSMTTGLFISFRVP